jgi:hypothetical protein
MQLILRPGKIAPSLLQRFGSSLQIEGLSKHTCVVANYSRLRIIG